MMITRDTPPAHLHMHHTTGEAFLKKQHHIRKLTASDVAYIRVIIRDLSDYIRQDLHCSTKIVSATELFLKAFKFDYTRET